MTEVKEKKIYKRLPLDTEGNLIKNDIGIISPTNLVIVKYPKSGSTLSLCDVPKILIADSEGGTRYFKPSNRTLLIDEEIIGEFVQTSTYGAIPRTIFDLVDELKSANNMKEYFHNFNQMENTRDLKVKKELYDNLIYIINQMPFPILAIDTITSLINISNSAALYEYNKKVAKPKEDIKRVDEWGGISLIRRKFAEIKSFIENNAAPFIQYHGHITSKKKVLKKAEEDITALDIALEGILSVTFTHRADAVCTFYRNEEGCWLDFSKKEETDLGSRPPHLGSGKIKIADIISDEDLKKGVRPKTFWQNIYPEVNFS